MILIRLAFVMLLFSNLHGAVSFLQLRFNEILSKLLFFHQRVNREFSNQKFENCPMSKTVIQMYPFYPASGINQITYSGFSVISEQINGTLSMVLDVSKCDLAMKNCEKSSTRTIPGICKILELKETLFGNIFQSVKPPLECPIKAGNYSLGDSSIDMRAFSMMQLEGYVWAIKSRLVASDNDGRRTVLCVNTETKVVRTKAQA
jgi:hypothetical protein